jgi:hypothetical protein
MMSGRQTLDSLDHALQDIRRHIQELNAQIQRTSAELLSLSQAESEQYKAWAQLRIDQLTTGEVIDALDQAGQRVGEVLAARDSALQELQHRLDDMQKRQATLEAERAAQAQRVEEAAEALDAAEAAVQERLAQDTAYQAQLDRTHSADQTAKHAAQKTALAEQDRLEKGQPYETDRLFMYLWQRGYGTSRYRANALIRYLDGKVAKLCSYHGARANYAMLLEIPVRLREHTTQLRQRANTEFAELRTLEQAAASTSNMPRLQETHATAQKRLEALDEEMGHAEQQSQALWQEQAVFAAGEDERFRQAVQVLTTEFQRDSIVSLRHSAQATPSPADDAIVHRLAAIETKKVQIEAALAQHQHVLQGQQQRLRELESIRQEFKRQRFDDVHATFADGALLAMLLNQFMGGLLNGENLWRAVQRQYHPRRLHANPLFGSDGFGRPDRIWRSGEVGGEVGGGGFRTGGAFGTDENFRTGGTF